MVPIIPYICFHIRSYFVLFVWFQMKTHKQRITYMYIVIYVHIEFEYEQDVHVYNATNINEVSTSKFS